MRKLLVCVLTVAWTTAIIGCGDTGGKTDTEKEFLKLSKQYSARFYEKMTTQAETMQPVQVTAEAARIWDEVFSPHKALLSKRIQEILNDLDTCPPIQEDLYNEVASGARVEPPADQPQGIILKQFLWNPIGAAQMGLNNWLARLLQQQSFGMRSVMAANAPMFWEVTDRSVELPKLVLRQGPMVYTVDLSRKDDYYQVDKIRWLRPKSMGPVVPPTPPADAQPPAAPGTLPPAPGTLPPAPGTLPPALTPLAPTPPALTPPAPATPPEKAPAKAPAKG